MELFSIRIRRTFQLVSTVLDKGKEIICLAQQAKKAYESNCC